MEARFTERGRSLEELLILAIHESREGGPCKDHLIASSAEFIGLKNTLLIDGQEDIFIGKKAILPGFNRGLACCHLAFLGKGAFL